MNPRQCNPCREQNLECTGDEPECMRCLASGKQSECVYPVQPVTKRRTKLAKRKACEPCKRKKRKCDGVHPQCGTCSASGSVCSWDSTHMRPSGKLRKIMPLETSPSTSGEMKQPHPQPPVASTSYLPQLPDSESSTLGYDAIANDPQGQPFELPMMPLSDPYAQAGLIDPSFFALPDAPSSDLDPNFFIPPSSD